MAILLVDCLGGSFLKVDIDGAVQGKSATSVLIIESDACRVSLCFRYLYSVDIL